MTGATPEDREGFAAFFLRARGQGISDQKLLAAIEATPRHNFVPGEYQSAAFSPRMIPIECGETIEGLDLQVRILSELAIEPGHRVLEIGTGSGFTSAVMARLAARVTTVERFRTLVDLARHRHTMLELANIFVRQGNAEHAVQGEGPFDRIVVWAAFEAMPRQFVELLSSGGIMLAPIGGGEEEQVFAKLVKVGSRFERQNVASVRLQPLQTDVAAAL